MNVTVLPIWLLLSLMAAHGLAAPTSMPEGVGSPSPTAHVDMITARQYLKSYYRQQEEPLGPGKRKSLSFASKLKNMQMFFGLNATGGLNQDTLEVMRRPRCGVPDTKEHISRIQRTRRKKVITYCFGKYTTALPRSTVDSLFESAFRIWAGVTGLTFVRLHSHNADIKVEFVAKEHGDSFAFDGPNGSLAHAFGPGHGIAGEMHFDNDEHWTTTGTSGFNLKVVAAHELGHMLGLKHSENPTSIMHPIYKAYPSGADLLSQEDITNINALYPPAQDHPVSFARPHPRHIRNRCAPDVTFDAVSTLGDATIFFKDRYLWIKHNEAYDIKEGPTTNFMPKIETSIDAAFWVPRRSTAYLIHESMFWMVKGSVVKGKPRALCHFGFPAWVQDVDAAVHIVKTGRTLFFMHDIYWSYNENRRVMDFSYPKYISEDFPGINSTINAAVHKEGFIYFFVGPQVYKYDYTHKLIGGVEKANSWLGC